MDKTKLTIDTARERLHDIIRKDVPFDQKAREALELGAQYFGADIGHLAQIDEATDHWEAVVTTAADDSMAADVERDLQDTYCRETIKGKSVLDIHDAEALGWADDPACKTQGQYTYLGVPLILEDNPYGTVCFVAKDPRSEQFSTAETRFAEDLTRLLERELAREQVEEELTNQTNLAAVLNRVIRHNLRNDVTVIGGYTDIVAEQINDETQIEPIRTHVDRLIDLSEKARELERIITTEADTQPTPVGPFVEEIVEPVAEEYNGPAVSVEYDQEVTAPLRSTFERAIRELVENAIKASSEDGTVEVTVDTIPNAVEIRIKDTGPGLPEQEREVLATGVETPLTHGSGLGLWLAHWIVSQHNGSISPSVSQDGTMISITIPRTPSPSRQQDLPEIERGRDRFEAAFNEAYEAMLVLNSDGHVVNANSAAGDIFGLDRDALLGRSLEAFFPDEFDYEAAWQEFQRTGTVRDNTTIVRADGEHRSVEFSATADIVAGEHLLVARDITERKERERELEVAETVFQTTQDALFLADVDEQEYHLNRVNDVFEDLTHRNSGTITGMSPQEMLGQEAGTEVQAQFKKCVKSEEPIEFEQEVPVDSGSRIWDVRLSPVMQEGEVTQLVGAMRNITERKDRERRYNAIFNQTYQYTGLLEPDGTIIEANQSALEFGDLDREDIIGRPFWEIDWWQDDDQQTIRDAIDRAAEGEFIRTEIEAEGSEESAIIDFSIRPITDDQDNVTLLIPEGRDITERKGRERKLREQQDTLQVYERAVENSTNLLGAVDPEYNLLFANEKYRDHFDLSREDIGEISLPEYIGEDWEAVVKPHVDRALSGEEVSYQFERDGPRGDMQTLEVRYYPLTNDGVVSGAVAAMRDITERNKREQELERYERIVESINNAIWIIDDDNQITFTNQTLADQLPVSREEVIGEALSTFSDIFVDTETYQSYRDLVDAVRTGETNEGELDATLAVADGERVANIRLVSLSNEAQSSPVIGIATDITERKEREATLARRTQAMDKAPIGITIADPNQADNPMIYANDAFVDLTGYSGEEILGQNCRFLQGEDTAPEHVAQIRSAIDAGNAVSVDLKNYRKDGTEFWNHLEIAPVHDDAGELINWIGFQEDVTERIERQQQLKLAETVFENTQDALFVVDVTEDHEFHIERVNGVYEELTGLSNTEITGKTPTEAVGEDIGREIESQYRECVQRQETIKYPEEIPVDEEQRQWETKVTPVMTEGRVDKLVGAMRDVTTA